MPIVDRLRALGHDTLTSQDAGRAGQSIPDEQVLQFAVEQRRAIVCHFDRDFVRFTANIDQSIRPLGDDLAGKLIRVNRKP